MFDDYMCPFFLVTRETCQTNPEDLLYDADLQDPLVKCLVRSVGDT